MASQNVMNRSNSILFLCIVIFLVSVVVKCYLGAGYRSTDFEVHRNWLAITHSLPLSQWYTDETSIWTLDYPPFFAYFEWLLSQAAQFVDPGMLVVSNLGYNSTLTVIFQRASVIVVDVVLLLGVFRFIKATIPDSAPLNEPVDDPKTDIKERMFETKLLAIIFATLFSAGLFMVDHIHFQYNGMMLGILLLSLAAIRGERNLEAAFWFAVLLNFKHIFLYVAPIYGVYLLRVSVLNRERWWDIRRIQWKNVAALFLILAIIFGLSLAPFLALGQASQLVSRLFPFKRGLVHAYWAPNAWSLYMFADLVLARLLKIRSSVPTSTSGLVGSTATLVLPNIPPWVTLLLTVASMAPLLWKVWHRPSPKTFLYAFVPLSLCSFLFGWHVHEKAILITLIPFGLIAFESPEWTSAFLRLSLVGHFSLIPLFLEELPKYYDLYFLILLHWFVLLRICDRYHKLEEKLYKSKKEDSPRSTQPKSSAPPNKAQTTRKRIKIAGKLDYTILTGIVVLGLVNGAVLPTFLPKYEFLPLLVTSVFSATFVVKLFLDLCFMTLRG